MFDPVTVTIDALTERGEGVVHAEFELGLPQKKLQVPYALPGERVTIQPVRRQRGGIEGRLLTLISPSPERQPAACRHFGICGGCALQHMTADAVRVLKTKRVLTLLTERGLDLAQLPPLSYGVSQPGERRRAVFSAQMPMKGGDLVLGFNQRAQHVLVNLTECPVMHPSIMALLPPLRQTLAKILQPGMSADCLVTVTATGLDLVIRGIGITIRGKKGKGKRRFGAIGLAEREALAALAAGQNLARLIWHGAGGRPELIAEHQMPRMVFANVGVAFPPGGFLQATPSGEKMILAALLRGLPQGLSQGQTLAANSGGKNLVELFSGLGSFTLPLAQAGYKVVAYEGDAAAVAALMQAARQAEFAQAVQVGQRDLFADPLSAAELAETDILVLDPPRSGAIEQILQIPPVHVKARLRHIAYISCDADSFARDAQHLQQLGYEVRELHVIDQFLWSSHVELVAHFSAAVS